ncbi:hypothetical protein ACVFI8_16530 [Agarivorans sp. MS3-6]
MLCALLLFGLSLTVAERWGKVVGSDVCIGVVSVIYDDSPSHDEASDGRLLRYVLVLLIH